MRLISTDSLRHLIHRQESTGSRLALTGSVIASAGTATPTLREKKIAMLGDSITADDGYGKTLRKALPGFVVDNFGISGQSSTKIKNRIKQIDSSTTGKKALDLANYGTVVVLAGVNNTGKVEQVKSDLEQIYAAARLAGVKVVAVTLPPWRSKYWNPTLAKNTLEINEWIRAQNGKTVDAVVDLYALLDDGTGKQAKDYKKDGLHPNAKGQAALGELVLAELRRLNVAPSVHTQEAAHPCTDRFEKRTSNRGAW